MRQQPWIRLDYYGLQVAAFACSLLVPKLLDTSADGDSDRLGNIGCSITGGLTVVTAKITLQLQQERNTILHPIHLSLQMAAVFIIGFILSTSLSLEGTAVLSIMVLGLALAADGPAVARITCSKFSNLWRQCTGQAAAQETPTLS